MHQEPLQPFRIQIVSDVHLEFYPGGCPFEDLIGCPVAPVLGLLGDIGVVTNPAGRKAYATLVSWCASRWEQVLVVAGNHEYYNTHLGCQGVDAARPVSVQAAKAIMQEVCGQHANVRFLDRGKVELAGWVVLGCTLWSHIPDQAQREVEQNMNDYELVFKDSGDPETPGCWPCAGPRRVLPVDTEAWFQKDQRWLENSIREEAEAGRPIVVLTHHAPTFEGTSHPRHGRPDLDGRSMNLVGHAFASNMEHCMGGQVRLWCYGHTHWNNDQLIQGTRVMANQLGYPSVGGASAGNYGYQPGLVVEVSEVAPTELVGQPRLSSTHGSNLAETHHPNPYGNTFDGCERELDDEPSGALNDGMVLDMV